ncbi:MAG TPA: N-acetylmuramoyl-L-alanine amidase, partial [Candidatus Ozemobacteraceae bacterium]|nr:N-acetylmuramoyl-L-alanine amidase [Candidatus Ozemobacteraceae bacterium]
MKAQKLSLVFLVLSLVLLAGAAAEARLSSHYQPLAGYVIMLDPGHGGADPGAIGPTGLKESVTNLRVARYLRQLLQDDGAEVVMTREGDETVSLSDRVEKARQLKPDLFVSIHHNASLRPGAENKGEIYFNALDRGIPLQVADSMNEQLGQSNLASRTQLIPGGFYVLRNNPAPAILTEAAYISVPESERVLRSGKGLTEEAQRFRLAIRQTFGTSGPLRIKIISSMPAKTVSPFLNLLIESNKNIGKVEVRMTGPGNSSFGFERLPAIGNMYSLFNLQPLPTGDYELTFICRGVDGSLSQKEILPVQVRLPVTEAVLLPVAPFIPEGLAGEFPIRVLLKDANGKVNRQAIPFSVEYGSENLKAMTRPDGQGFFQITLQGTETDQVRLKATFETGQEQTLEIPVRKNEKTFVLGRVVSMPEKEGMEQVRISYGRDRVTTTAPGGYFFCEYSKVFRNLKLHLQPPLGYASAAVMINSNGA